MTKHRLLAASIAVLALATAAPAASVGELASGVASAQRRADSLASKRWNVEAETELVNRIDRLCDDFHGLAEAGASMPKTAYALLNLIERTRDRHTNVLEELQAEVIRLDGDLEAVQDSAAWRQRELLAMRLLYRLNWVRYEVAMRYERSSSKRARLLTRSRNGFAEFLSSGDRELTIEALLGHGLTNKAMREYSTAVSDFESALSQGPDTATANKLRAALADALISMGRISAALDQTARLARSASGKEIRAQARFLRSKALLLAVGKYKTSFDASRRAAFRSEAAKTMESLYSTNRYWRSKVVQLIDAGIEDPLEWAADQSSPFVTFLIANSLRRRGECDDAVPLYEAMIGRDEYITESYYGVGFCNFHESLYAQAITELSRFLELADRGDPHLGQAAYLRFKAAESQYLKALEAGGGGGDIEESYADYLESFVELAPGHERAHEGWFRLGELYRSRGRLVDAAEAFANVEGDPAFTVNASFQSAQCYFEAVDAASKDGAADIDLVRKAMDSFDGFDSRAQAFREQRKAGQGTDALIDPLQAKATVMAAATTTAGGHATMEDRLRRLAEFETRFPDQLSLFPEVSFLRITAYRRMEDMDSAGKEVETLLAATEGDASHSATLKKLGLAFLKDGAEREEKGDTGGADRSRRVALRVYERLLADMRAGRLQADSTAGLEKIVTDLRAGLGG